MGMAAKDKKAKKAGPKGKKARKLAKLDNRWGEAAAVDADTGEEIRKKTRRGRDSKNSALKGDVNRKLSKHSNEGIDGFYHRLAKGRAEQYQQQYQQQQQARESRRRVVEYDDSSSDSDSDSDEDLDRQHGADDDCVDSEMGHQNNPMGGLLTMIRNKNSKNRTGDDDGEDESDEDREENGSDSDSSDSEDESDSDSDDDDEEKMVDDEENSKNDANDAAVAVDTSASNPGSDFFRKRFGRPPLNKSELLQLEGPQTKKPTMKKIACGKHVELQYTLSLVNGRNDNNGNKGEDGNINDDSTDDILCGDLLALETPEAWQASASEAYSKSTREVLQRHWIRGGKKKNNPKNKNKNDAILSDTQAPVYSFLARYADVFETTSATGKGSNNSKSDSKTQKDQHRLQVLHVLNHVLTLRTRIGRNNRYLKEKEAAEKAAEKAAAATAEEKKQDDKDTAKKSSSSLSLSLGDTTDVVEEERDVRDQGFTRPTVLVLLPTRGTCHRFIKDLYKLSGATIDEEQEDRFDADYGELIDEDDEDETMDPNPKKAAKTEAHRKAVLASKGKEWNEFFGDKANQDDDFKIGVSLIPKTANKGGKNKSNISSNVSLRLYSDFFKSDIIVASPLGLKMLLTPDAGGDDDDSEDESNNKKRKGSSDYLSSIEICLLQHSEMILMQNWDHVNDILSLLNKEPISNNGTDFSRVRNYLLDGQGARWRQLILSSKFWDPALLSTFKRFGKSLSGQVKVRRKIRDGDTSISRVLVPVKQVFQKVPTGTFAQQSKARVDYFVKNLWPELKKNDQKHTLVFIPSYFDFCALRNALLKLEQKHLFVSVSEYSRGTEITRGRARFAQGRKPLMLYTGRAHYFHRHAIRGVHNLVVLGLPEHPEFYADFVNLIQTTGGSDNDAMDEGQHRETSCLALFTKYEAHALERIVGSSNASRMLSSLNSAFMFYS